MSVAFRRVLTALLLGMVLASLVAVFWQNFHLIAIRPTTPQPALGFVVPFDDHGTFYYVTRAEHARFMLSFWSGGCLFLLAIAAAPKDFVLPPPGTPRWITYVSAQARTGLEEFSWFYLAAAGVGAGVWGGVAVTAGGAIARFALHHGLVGG